VEGALIGKGAPGSAVQSPGTGAAASDSLCFRPERADPGGAPVIGSRSLSGRWTYGTYALPFSAVSPLPVRVAAPEGPPVSPVPSPPPTFPCWHIALSPILGASPSLQCPRSSEQSMLFCRDWIRTLRLLPPPPPSAPPWPGGCPAAPALSHSGMPRLPSTLAPAMISMAPQGPLPNPVSVLRCTRLGRGSVRVRVSRKVRLRCARCAGGAQAPASNGTMTCLHSEKQFLPGALEGPLTP